MISSCLFFGGKEAACVALEEPPDSVKVHGCMMNRRRETILCKARSMVSRVMLKCYGEWVREQHVQEIFFYRTDTFKINTLVPFAFSFLDFRKKFEF